MKRNRRLPKNMKSDKGSDSGLAQGGSQLEHRHEIQNDTIDAYSVLGVSFSIFRVLMQVRSFEVF